LTTPFDPNRTGKFKAVKSMERVEVEVALAIILLIALCGILAYFVQ
jgi:hypothetical protein